MPLLCLLTTLAAEPATFANDLARLRIAPDGTWLEVADLASGANLAQAGPIARIQRGGAAQLCTGARREGERLHLAFGDSGVTAVLRVTVRPLHFVFEVESVAGEGVESFTFLDLTAAVTPGGPHAVCALARNLRTRVPALPGPMNHPSATCYAKLGLVGASAALVAGPAGRLRDALQEACAAAPELPQSRVGGAWALDGPANRSSYVFNFDGITTATADAWIARVRSLGFNQVQMHGGAQFRFGDCRLDPNIWPNGLADLRAATDRLHAAGLLVGMQPYAFFIDKRCDWVTPVPDRRLASSATFTLAEPIDAAATTISVTEPTDKVSTITGFFVRNSVTLRIDDELITFAGARAEPPYGFTQCQRGALGTTPAPHAAGAVAYQLKECFGLFVPDPETTLFEEVAAANAKLFNEGGYDVIYFDALDGEDVLGGAEWGWHYGARYAWEVYRRLERPAVIEYSTFHHLLWPLRSRMGAWDHPNRGHKRFIDLHLAANEDNTRRFLPSNLGWWALLTYNGPNVEPTFADDIEYLCGKALGTDSGLSMVGYNPDSPGHQRLAAIVKQYEELRQGGAVPESIKARLRVPGDEFTLEAGRFRPVTYAKRTVALDREPVSWRVTNPYAAQTPTVRIEALASIGGEEAGVVLADPGAAGAFPGRAVAQNVTAELWPDNAEIEGRAGTARLTAASTRAERPGSWAKFEHPFAQPQDRSVAPAIGLWVHGDGQGEVLNVQLHSPDHISHGALREHYIEIDFTGWRYVTFLEPDSDRWPELRWPYGWSYAIFREIVRADMLDRVTLWLGNLPPGGSVDLRLGPIVSLPVGEAPVVHPALSAGGRTLTFPVTIPTGAYLEYAQPAGVLYGRQGEKLADVTPTGEPPVLDGETELQFTGGEPGARMRVTIGVRGEPIG